MTPPQVDQEEFWQRPIYRTRKGVEFFRKPGRRKSLTAEQAALVFEAQVQIRAANKFIGRVLAGSKLTRTKACRTRVLKENWLDRGRIDVLRPGQAPKAQR